MSREIDERKFIVYNISSLFKFYETTFCTISFDWIESTKICKARTNSGIVKVDSKGFRLSDNQEIWHLEVADSSSHPTTSSTAGDSKKSLSIDILNLISVLQNYLDCKIELATRIKIFSSLVIGE